MHTKIQRCCAVLFTIAVAFGSNAYAARGASDLLKYIPADSPYVFATTEPVPDEFNEKVEPILDELLATYRRAARAFLSVHLVEMAEKNDEQAELFRDLSEEVLGLMSLEGLRGAGFETGSLGAFYGNGLLPVMRFELSDGDLFDATIARFEEKLGKGMATGAIGRDSYRYFDFEAFRILLASIDDYAIITLVPGSFDDEAVAVALGIEKPKKNMRKAGHLKKIRKEYGYLDYMTGYIDVRSIVDTFSGGATGTDAAMFEAFGMPKTELSAVCRSEFMELADITPRMVFGYDALDASKMSSSMVVELREDIAEGLATIPAAVPGLGVDGGGFMSFGFSMNPLMLRNFMEARIAAMEEDPFECEKLAAIQHGAAGGREALSQPVPPVVYNFRGIIANIVDFDESSIGGDGIPEELDATALIAIEDAESLLMMGAMMDPELAALDIKPDGKPVKLELAALAEAALDFYGALTDNAMSISVGDGAETNVVAALNATSVEPPPLFSVGLDGQRYYAMTANSMMAGEENEKMPVAFREAVRDMMMVFARLYDRIGLDVRLTERGVEIDTSVLLGDF